MRFVLTRILFADSWTLGSLATAYGYHCWTCEDTVRAPGIKVPGKTAIPAGNYRVVVDYSPKFGRMLPHLLGVPGFDGIRIHPGNTAQDTEGCILPGSIPGTIGVLNSREAFGHLYQLLQQSEPHSITIINGK